MLASATKEYSMSFAGKVVWVTGASSGIGEALAREMLGAGAWVVVSGRNLDALEHVAALAPDRALVLPFESTNFNELPRIVHSAWQWQGRIDVLINNAGVSQRSLALDTSFDVYRRLIEVDYLAPVALTQQLLPLMVQRRCGHIAVVSSVAGKVGTPLRSGYCGAKHAVVGFFDSLRAEVELAYGIQVSVILPGSVQTAVAVNALSGTGSARGRSDPNIENGMPVEVAVRTIIDGLSRGLREIPVAEGFEFAALRLRTHAPERLYDTLSQEGARLAKVRAQQGPDSSLDPIDVRSIKA